MPNEKKNLLETVDEKASASTETDQLTPPKGCRGSIATALRRQLGLV